MSRVKTKEQIAEELRRRASSNIDILLCKTQKRDSQSDWSYQFKLKENEKVEDYLKRIFEIKALDWSQKFLEATHGDGNELCRILTLHSSALLPLLCFQRVSNENPIEIGGICYTQRWFEVKNKVFNRPSNIDVVLRSDDGQLLFLESKFTEYLSPDSKTFSSEYFEFYKTILPLIDKFPLQLVFPCKYKSEARMRLKPKSDKKLYKSLYMDGIKQCFSHLIGLAQGREGDAECWKKVKGKIQFGTILYYVPGNSFKAYSEFYKLTIAKVSPEMIKKSLPERDIPYADRISILPEVLTYQAVFNNYDLGKKIKSFYDL